MTSHLDESSLPDGRRVIAVSGELDRIELPALRTAIQDAFRENREVVLDLSRVTYLDSSILAALIAESLDADKRGARIVVVTGHEGIMRTLELKGLVQVMHIAETLDQLRDAPPA